MMDFYWFWLCNIPGIGRKKITKLLNIFSYPKEIYNCSEKVLANASGLTEKNIENIKASKVDESAYKNFKELEKKGIEFVTFEDKEYPERLRNIPDSPMLLYMKGKLPAENQPTVSIVGARNCTEYGKNVAYEMSKAFALMGIQVVSGMASGIDTYAHKGCIAGGGNTFAVLGCGVDVCYPRENIGLYEEMKMSGGIVSEYAVNTPPNPGQFPERNRIISGLSDVVIVVEAREKSGSLITVDQALEQNREVMAVPGRIFDKLSDGCNNLIRLGAQIITKPEDVLDNLKISTLLDKSAKNQEVIENFSEKVENTTLVKTEKVLYSCLSLYPKTVDELVKSSGLSLQEVNLKLFNMQIAGLVKEVSKNCFVKVQRNI